MILHIRKTTHLFVGSFFCSWEHLLRTLWVLWQPTLLHYNLRVPSRNRGWSIILCFVFSSFILFSILSRLVSLEDMAYKNKCMMLYYSSLLSFVFCSVALFSSAEKASLFAPHAKERRCEVVSSDTGKLEDIDMKSVIRAVSAMEEALAVVAV